MKWMIASDLHGSAYYCKKMVEAFEREGADRLLMLGSAPQEIGKTNHRIL